LTKLKEALANANQFWLISGDRKWFTDAHIEAVVQEWQAGLGM
jgi:hypothetical protein